MAKATVTPKMAAQWLAKSTNKNRAISEAVVRRYSEAMKNGRWMYDGEPIILDKDGNVLNGQHRLRACVFSNHAFETEVITNIDPGAFRYMDTGKLRTAGDRMAIRGEDYHSLLGSAVTWMAKLEDTRMLIHGKFKVSPDLEETYLKKYPSIREHLAAIQSSNFFRKEIRNVALLAALKTLFTEKVDKDSADLFFEELESGAGLTRESPVRGLRDRLIAEAAQRSTTMKKTYMAGLIVKAFNYYHFSVPLSETRLAPAEEFPGIGDDPRGKPSIRRKMRRRAAAHASAPVA